MRLVPADLMCFGCGGGRCNVDIGRGLGGGRSGLYASPPNNCDSPLTIEWVEGRFVFLAVLAFGFFPFTSTTPAATNAAAAVTAASASFNCSCKDALQETMCCIRGSNTRKGTRVCCMRRAKYDKEMYDTKVYLLDRIGRVHVDCSIEKHNEVSCRD